MATQLNDPIVLGHIEGTDKGPVTVLSEVLNELVENRSLDRTILEGIVCEGMKAAYEKRYPDLELKVQYDPTQGISVLGYKAVVSTVEDPDSEISLRKARQIDSSVSVGDFAWAPIEGGVGRIEILHAKQVIASLIRKVEAEAVYNEFKDREGEVVYGIVHKCGREGTVVKIDDVLAFMPASLSIPEEKCQVGFSVRALLKEVLEEPRNDNQLILDRASEAFLKRLFELEIPEVFERIVEIKTIVRTAGYKSKVVVISNDRNIDPVGTCVGVGGSRIKPILKEIGGERIDIIAVSDSPEEMVRGALKPAKVNRVEIDDGVAKVWVDEDQRSLAIGKMGQNIALASRLTGLDIRLDQGEEKRALSEAVGVDTQE